MRNLFAGGILSNSPRRTLPVDSLNHVHDNPIRREMAESLTE
jgi:hypothetical protein